MKYKLTPLITDPSVTAFQAAETATQRLCSRALLPMTALVQCESTVVHAHWMGPDSTAPKAVAAIEVSHTEAPVDGRWR